MGIVKSFGLIALGVLIAYSMAYTQPKETGAIGQRAESTFAQVMRTKTIRCGWVNYQPATYKDAKTGEMRGIYVEAMDQIAKQLDWKIDWSYETSWATFYEDLRLNKFDVACTAVWMLPTQELKLGEFTNPLYYSTIGAWVRAGNQNFDNNLQSFNDDNVTIAGIDGSYALILAQRKFPQAKVLSSPPSAEYVTGLLNVAYGKADVTFVENWLASGYAQKNPDALRQVSLQKSIDTRPNVMMVRKGEFEMLSVLNYALLNLHLSGQMEEIIAKHENAPGNFIRVKLNNVVN